jgi:hypothetical protein
MRTEAYNNNPKIPEINYEQLLEIRLVDMDKEKKYNSLKFAVTGNYVIFVTSRYHEHLMTDYGVDLESTLTEGDIKFTDKGKIEKISFKHPIYQKIPGFTGSPAELTKLQDAVEKLIRNTLQGETEKNKSLLLN